MSDMKPCPFCGGSAVIRMQRLQGIYQVPVVSCDCGALIAFGTNTPKTTAAAWNRRADAPAKKRKSKSKTEVTENGME